MESLHIANLLDEKGKTLLKEIFPKKIREELKNSRKIDDKLSKKICHNLKWFYIWFLIYFIALFIYAIFTVINITTLIHMVRISADMSIFKNMEILVLFQVMLTGNLIIETLYPVIHMLFGYKHDKYPYGKPQTDEVARGSGNREYGCRRLREKLPNFSGVSFF